jgi:hypothetical protein
VFALSPEDEAAEREKELLSSKANAIRVWLDGASIVYRKIWLDELFKSCLPTTLKVCILCIADWRGFVLSRLLPLIMRERESGRNE